MKTNWYFVCTDRNCEYAIFREIYGKKAHWKAMKYSIYRDKYDCKIDNIDIDNEMFDIDYEQALGYKPIGKPKLSAILGSLLLP